MSSNPKSSIKNQKSPFGPTPWRLMGMGLELGVVIGGLTYLGHLADGKFNTSPWLALSGALLSTLGGTYNIAREMLKPPRPRPRKSPGKSPSKTPKQPAPEDSNTPPGSES